MPKKASTKRSGTSAVRKGGEKAKAFQTSYTQLASTQTDFTYPQLQQQQQYIPI